MRRREHELSRSLALSTDLQHPGSNRTGGWHAPAGSKEEVKTKEKESKRDHLLLRHPGSAGNGEANRDLRYGFFFKVIYLEKFLRNHLPNLFLRVPWTSRTSNQAILKEISTEYSLEGLMLKLKLQYFGHLMQRSDSLKRLWCWERLRAGGEGDDRGWDGWMASPTRWTWLWASSGSWWWTRKPGVAKSQTQLSDWTELNLYLFQMKVFSYYFW